MSKARDKQIYAAPWWPPLEALVWAYRAHCGNSVPIMDPDRKVVVCL